MYLSELVFVFSRYMPRWDFWAIQQLQYYLTICYLPIYPLWDLLAQSLKCILAESLLSELVCLTHTTSFFSNLVFYIQNDHFPLSQYSLILKKRFGQIENNYLQNIFGIGVRQGSMLSLCLFNLYAEYIMRNTVLHKLKLESRLSGEISVTLDMWMTPPLQRKVKKN